MVFMTLEEAVDFFNQRKGNCAQAIFAMYNNAFNLSNIDPATCLKLTAAFGGGIANTGNVCGALTGALMILGLKYGVSDNESANKEDIMKVIMLSQQLLEKFEELHGSILCKELINHDLRTPEDIQHAFESGAFDKCSKIVEDTSSLLDDLIDD